MKRLLAFLLVLASLLSPAYAQKTKSQLNTEITTNFPDNTTGLITPLILRNTTTDFVNSWQQATAVNAQTGASYTIAVSDYGQLVTTNNANPIAVSLPQAIGSFSSFNFYLRNVGLGTATITPTTSTVCGSASVAVPSANAIWVVSDGVNYQCFGPFTIGAGAGTVTSVGLSLPGIFTVTGSPVTGAGTLTGTASGTTGGIPYFSSGTTLASSATLTANAPVVGGGAGASPSVGARSGNTTTFVTTTGTLTSSHCVNIDVNGNFVDSGAVCGGGGGGVAGANTQVQFNASGVFGASPNFTWVSPTLTLGVAASVTGQLALTNATAGTVTVQVPASVTPYNFNLPSTAGIANTPLLSGGGGSALQTYGAITYPPSAVSGGVPFFSSTIAMSSSGLLGLNGVVIGGGAGAGPTTIAAGSSAQLLLGVTGAAPQFNTMSQDCTIQNNGVITCTRTNNVAFGPFATQAVPCVIAQGCTGQITASAARQATGLNIWGDSSTGHGDTNVTIANTERLSFTNAAFTASRTWTLPAANSTGSSFTLMIADMAGGVTAVNTLVISRAGADTINGGTTATIAAANGAYICASDGTSKWTCQSTGAASAGGVTSITAGFGLTGGTITTSGTLTVPLIASYSQAYLGGI